MSAMGQSGTHLFQIPMIALYDDATVQGVHREIDELLETQPVKSLILDFTHVEITGTAGLSMLVRLKSKCDERGCQLGLCGMKPTVREVLRITKLDQLFRIDETAIQA